MIDRIITAKDFAAQEGVRTVRDRILRMANVYRMHVVTDVKGKPVEARIDWGRWVADCECGGAEAVDADEPIFFCFSCGNSKNGGALRPVVFPSKDELKRIEAAILDVPVRTRPAMNDIKEAMTAQPLVVLPGPVESIRSWSKSEETVEQLEERARLSKEIHAKGAK